MEAPRAGINANRDAQFRIQFSLCAPFNNTESITRSPEPSLMWWKRLIFVPASIALLSLLIPACASYGTPYYMGSHAYGAGFYGAYPRNEVFFGRAGYGGFYRPWRAGWWDGRGWVR
jgi:hypothetical protein